MSSPPILSSSNPRTDSHKDLAREAGWVGAGGAVGALARSAIAWVAPQIGGSEFAATQAVNLTGALALGILFGAIERRGPCPRMRAFLGVGVLGSFTTFATLVDESRSIASATSSVVGFAYLTSSLAVGTFGFWLGDRGGRRLPMRSPSRHAETARTP